MTQKKIKFCIAISLCTVIFKVNAQDAIPASGSNATGSGGSVSYSIGQVIYTAHAGTSGSIIQGVQQPYEISIVTAIEDSSAISLSMVVYPNPVTASLTLTVGDYKNQNLFFVLYDIHGKIIENKKIESTKTLVSMENYASGIYFLKVIEGNKELRIFKIIKN